MYLFLPSRVTFICRFFISLFPSSLFFPPHLLFVSSYFKFSVWNFFGSFQFYFLKSSAFWESLRMFVAVFYYLQVDNQSSGQPGKHNYGKLDNTVSLSLYSKVTYDEQLVAFIVFYSFLIKILLILLPEVLVIMSFFLLWFTFIFFSYYRHFDYVYPLFCLFFYSVAFLFVILFHLLLFFLFLYFPRHLIFSVPQTASYYSSSTSSFSSSSSSSSCTLSLGRVLPPSPRLASVTQPLPANSMQLSFLILNCKTPGWDPEFIASLPEQTNALYWN